MKRRLFLTLALLVLPGCALTEERIPEYVSPPPRSPFMFRVCKDPITEARVYEQTYCEEGSSRCSWWFYDANGVLIEEHKTDADTPRAERSPKTRAGECIQTTDEYFLKKVPNRYEFPQLNIMM